MSAKRKTSAMATAVAMDDGDGHALKKRKVSLNEETPENTTEVGLEFLHQINVTRDKRNRLIATHFLTLPDRKRIPQYYMEIGLPMALDTIEGKLNRREYPTLTTLESDLRRMVSNAKSFNEKSSELFSDAEKIRKLVVAFMTKNNPAYESGDYAPFSTPVPPGWRERLQQLDAESHDLDADGETDPDEPADSTALSPTATGAHHNTLRNDRRESSTPVVPDAEGAGESFEGNSFQQAQEKILTELINLKNEELHPVCLKSAQKAVKGIRGREKPTGQTFMKSWQSFEDEISHVWNNAREYNEDGSDILKLAGQLESYFNRRLAEAKRAVSEPPQPKVKLRMSAKTPETNPKITLRFGGQKAGGSAGVSVDSEALKRQQDLVKAGANGQGTAASDPTPRSGTLNPFGGSPSALGSTKIPSLPTASQDSTRSASAERPTSSTNGVKNELAPGQSPALGAVQLNRELSRSSDPPNLAVSSMPPPSSVTSRIASNSPHPPTAANHLHGWNAQPSVTSFDSRWRQAGKDAKDALISNLSISTDPGLKLDRHFHLDIPPLAHTSQQSVTINIPKTHHYLRVVPTIASHAMQRPNKIFVTVGTQRLSSMPQRAEDTDPRKPLYEARVVPGVNRIEVEMIAGTPRGTPKGGSGQEIELEKVTVFVHVAKN
ncbi:hypothetical protein MMC07_007584 [Pseudocyphellaria aurata]|nr:hypothetical protein [Pseudocyphellaria aurata]